MTASLLAQALAEPVTRPARMKCGIKLLRARLSPEDVALLDDAITTVRAELETYTLGTAPHSCSWLLRTLKAAGEPVGLNVINRHVTGKCSC